MKAKRNEDECKRPLTPRQIAALPLLVQGKSIEEGCKLAGISKRSYYEWIRNEDFATALAEMQDDMLRQALEVLKAHTKDAADTLTKLLKTKNEPLKRLVCNDILDRVIKHNEQQEIVERLEKLERIIENNDLARHRKVS